MFKGWGGLLSIRPDFTCGLWTRIYPLFLLPSSVESNHLLPSASLHPRSASVFISIFQFQPVCWRCWITCGKSHEVHDDIPCFLLYSIGIRMRYAVSLTPFPLEFDLVMFIEFGSSSLLIWIMTLSSSLPYSAFKEMLFSSSHPNSPILFLLSFLLIPSSAFPNKSQQSQPLNSNFSNFLRAVFFPFPFAPDFLSSWNQIF